jgi:hypothetical protein
MPKVVTSDTPEMEGALVIRVVGVELSTLTTIGFAAELRVSMGAVSYRGLVVMELPSHTSRASDQTQAVM